MTNPYATPGGKETTSITGGALKVTRVGDLKKPDYDALVTKFTEGPLKWSFDCDRGEELRHARGGGRLRGRGPGGHGDLAVPLIRPLPQAACCCSWSLR